jgi:hypothetical protein
MQSRFQNTAQCYPAAASQANAALVMIGALLIGLAWVYNEYGATAFWVGVAPVVFVAVWVECNTPIIPVYEVIMKRRPSRTRLSPDPVNRPFRHRAHKLGLVRTSRALVRAVRGLSRADRGRFKAGRQSPREQRAYHPICSGDRSSACCSGRLIGSGRCARRLRDEVHLRGERLDLD